MLMLGLWNLVSHIPWANHEDSGRTNHEGHIWAMKRLSFGYFYYIFASTCLRCFKFWLKTMKNPQNSILQCWIILGPHQSPMFRQCKDYVWRSFSSSPARYLKFPRLSEYGVGYIFKECLFLGPCLDHVGIMVGLS